MFETRKYLNAAERSQLSRQVKVKDTNTKTKTRTRTNTNTQHRRGKSALEAGKSETT